MNSDGTDDSGSPPTAGDPPPKNAKSRGESALNEPALDDRVFDDRVLDERAKAAAQNLLERQAGRRKAAERVFADGLLVAGRFRVLELLQQGGSGQVYRVLDEELGRQIALKTLHPGVAASPQALDRLKQELVLARSVTHENVCRLYEIGRHEEAGVVRLFLTMELVPGETLAHLAERDAPLPTGQVLTLGRQVAQGLAAAHRKGVAHRDLKGQNVLLQQLENQELRAVLTDFGLAGLIEDNNPSDGALVGTPLTMAPEQVRGDEVGTEADIYSFGIMLYHLSTGIWPFSGRTPLQTATRRLQQTPEPPRQLKPELPEELEELILHCLQSLPDGRPTVEQVLERLNRISSLDVDSVANSEPPAPKPAPTSRSGRPLIPWVALMVVLTLLVVLVIRRPQPPIPVPQDTLLPHSSTPASATEVQIPERRPSLLWLGLETRDSDDSDSQWLSRLVEAGLLASLSAAGDLRLPAEEVAESIRRELVEMPSPPFNSTTLKYLQKRSGVDLVLSGVAQPVGGGGLRLQLFLQPSPTALPSAAALPDATASSTSDTTPAAPAEPQPFSALVSADDLAGLGDQVAGLASNLRAVLSLRTPTKHQVSSAQAEIPQHPEAARLYAQGLSALRRVEIRQAAELLQQSLAVEPNHPKTLAALAQAWMRLGYGKRAKEAAQQAFEHAAGLSRAEQLSIEALHRMRQRDWQRAEEIFAALWEFFPDEAGHGIGLVSAQDRAGRLDQAFETLDRLHARLATLPPSAQHARIALSESMVAYHQGDYERSQRAARQATEIAEMLDAPSLVAEGIVQESLTRVITDPDLATVESNLQRAIDLLQQVREPRMLVRAQLYLADCARRRDHFETADSAYRQAIEIASAIGDHAELDRARTSLAILLDRKGLLRQGLVLKQEVLQSYRQRQVVQGAVIAQENVAITLLKMGQPATALEQLAEVEERYQQLDDRIGMAASPYYQGRAWLDRGEITVAERLLQRARKAADDQDEATRESLGAAVDFERGRLAWTRGRTDLASNLVEPLVPVYEKLQQPFDVAETRLLLAKIHRTQEQLEAAAEHAQAALSHFESTTVAHMIVAAQAEVVEIELARLRSLQAGELPLVRAVPSCARLASLPQTEHRRIALLAAVTLAKCQHQAGVGDREVLDRLAEVIAEAKQLEVFLPRLQAGTLRAQIHHDSGRSTEAQVELEELTRQAEERGFRPRQLPAVDLGRPLDPPKAEALNG